MLPALKTACAVRYMQDYARVESQRNSPAPPLARCRRGTCVSTRGCRAAVSRGEYLQGCGGDRRRLWPASTVGVLYLPQGLLPSATDEWRLTVAALPARVPMEIYFGSNGRGGRRETNSNLSIGGPGPRCRSLGGDGLCSGLDAERTGTTLEPAWRASSLHRQHR